METINFDEWLFEVCRISALRYFNKEKDEQYYFERINLNEAKLAFNDNENPEDFSKQYFYWSNNY